ncbi:COG2958 family protein [Thorsellia anophelis]|uniref:HrgA protein n=1 Tax=Thorsellia anophelis DSM 18579 TaxID=1123402 RepID=A0A1I0FU68_9GAMM|nr:HrgA protein [Thorsellia anophelis]SET62078.1 hypothetical protein SAMN02583745_02902 [Thorsellia anophelis DSM 18579]
MKLNLAKTVVDFLKENAEVKYTAREIALWIFENYPEQCQAKKNNSETLKTDVELINQIVAEIGSQRPRTQKRHPGLKITEGRPRKYYFSEKSDISAVENVEGHVTKKQTGDKNEHSLYPILSTFLWSEFEIYSKRIDEKRSSNMNGPKGNHWLHPDVVAMETLGVDWHSEVKSCVSHYAEKRTKLWSFEVKLLLNRSNARESFFQAVSNSSWANFGYLVAADIEGSETLKELRMLFAAHGIGLIKLDVENPAESQVLIPAREKDNVDWDMANRLTNENRDFVEYIKLVKQFYQTGEANPRDWDVPNDFEL